MSDGPTINHTEHSLEQRSGAQWRSLLENPSYLPPFGPLHDHLQHVRDAAAKESEVYDAKHGKFASYDLATPLPYEAERKAWVDFFYKRSIIEILNTEFINSLGDYLSNRIHDVSVTSGPVRILEPGAGGGQLTYHLSNYFREHHIDAHILAVDNNEYGISSKFPVIKMDYTESLGQYKPHIVICSWMPPRKDWSANFRKANVVEYLLIGDVFATGHEELTWGNNYKQRGEVPPYEADGYEMKTLDAIGRYEISWLIVDRQTIPSSNTVSFKKKL